MYPVCMLYPILRMKCLGPTRVSMEVIVTIVSKLVDFTHLGDVSNLLI